MDGEFPAEVKTVARRHGLSPAMAFGLGEGLNLYYSRHVGLAPPHRLHVLPPTFAATVAQRCEQPRPAAIAAALAGNGYGVMRCAGDWHGLDAIEKWGEELPLWPPESVVAATQLIEQSEGLYRRAYGAFLTEAQPHLSGLEEPRALVEEIAGRWLEIAARLRAGYPLERLSRHVLRMAAWESRFWGMILDRFGQGI